MIRDLVGGVARTTAGLWQGLADAVDAADGSPRDDDHRRPPTVDLSEAATSGPESVPEGAMLVPVDAWQRVLEQLGNLHEAGRELAEARERAAKAEAQVEFLRRQLADTREASRPAVPVEPTAPTDGEGGAAGRAVASVTRVRARARRFFA